jgi:hypothetical protein
MIVGMGRSRHTKTDFPHSFPGMPSKKTRKPKVIEWCSYRLLLIQYPTAEGFSWADLKKKKNPAYES